MADVVLIASRKDYFTIARMQEVLRAHGLDADIQDFVTGQSVDLQGRIEGSRMAVFFWSRDADGATEMRRKLGAVALALASGNVLVVRLDGAELPVGLRDLDQVTVDWGPRPRREDYEELARRIASAHVGRGVRSAAASEIAPSQPEQARVGSRSAVSLMAWIGAIAAVMIASATMWKTAAGSAPAQPLLFSGLLLAAIAAIGYFAMQSRQTRSSSPSEGSLPAAMTVPADRAPPPDVFISYSRKDAAFAGELVAALEAAGQRVWIDTRAPGESRYAGPIVRALRSARTVALLCSQNSFGSDHVMREVYLAGDFSKRLVAVRLDGTEFPDEFAYFLTGFPRVEAATRRVAEVSSEILSCMRT